jgi:hypothetical protein
MPVDKSKLRLAVMLATTKDLTLKQMSEHLGLASRQVLRLLNQIVDDGTSLEYKIEPHGRRVYNVVGSCNCLYCGSDIGAEMATKRNQWIVAASSEAEKAELDKAAKAAGVSVSNYIRGKIGLAPVQVGNPDMAGITEKSLKSRAKKKVTKK